jgi:hypothetical protein
MYGNSLLGGVAGVSAGGVAAGASTDAGRTALGTLGTLPFTGLDLVWFALAAFALFMAAGALWRIVPRRQA